MSRYRDSILKRSAGYYMWAFLLSLLIFQTAFATDQDAWHQLNESAQIALTAGDRSKCENLLHQALEDSEKLHPDLVHQALSLEKLAIFYGLNQNVKLEEEQLELLVKLRQNQFWNTHPSLLNEKDRLAKLLLAEGKYEQAICLLNDELKSTDFTNSPRYKENSLDELSKAYLGAGKLKAAEATVTELMNLKSKNYGKNSSKLIDANALMAEIEHRLGNTATAIQCMQAEVELCKRCENIPAIVASLHTLAQYQNEVGETQLSLVTQRNAIELLEKIDSSKEQLVSYKEQLSKNLETCNNISEAIKTMKEAAVIAKNFKGEDSLLCQRLNSELGRQYVVADRVELGKKLMERSFSKLLANGQINTAEMNVVSQNWAIYLLRHQATPDAERYFNQIEKLGHESLDPAVQEDALTRVGEWRLCHFEYIASAKAYEEAMHKMKADPKVPPERRAYLARELALSYEKLSRKDKAIEQYRFASEIFAKLPEHKKDFQACIARMAELKTQK